MASPFRGDTRRHAGVTLPARAQPPRIPMLAFGFSLGIFFVTTFVLCVGFDLLFPGHAMYETWLRLLPGFTWLTWQSFALGVIESFVYAWYVALIFCPLFNFFAARLR